ncbi:MAG: transketolase [Verrucomicrobia bacterium]|nr:transketolase [Verrucomicrobiota bacterium]
MRNTFADEFYKIGVEDERIAIVVADISPAGSIAKFRTEFPERFINTGVAEQIMIGMCAGMVQRGMRPFAYTIATFALYRPFEFVRDDLCYQNLPVTIVGIGGGVTYSTLGSTHHAMEDIGIASSIPNMRIIAPCDPAETRAATRWCAQQQEGPVYLRLGKAGEPDLTERAEDWEFGKLRYLRRGTDVCILGYGPVLKLGQDVADRYTERGASVSLCSVHTPKPLDEAAIVEAMANHKTVIVIEETTPTGSLGVNVKRLGFEHGATCQVHTFSLKDEFIHHYGDHAAILDAHGLSTPKILAALGI